MKSVQQLAEGSLSYFFVRYIRSLGCLAQLIELGYSNTVIETKNIDKPEPYAQFDPTSNPVFLSGLHGKESV